MARKRKDDSFVYFFEGYILEGFVMGIIFVVVFCIGLGAAYFHDRSDVQREKMLYEALESDAKLADEIKDGSDTGQAVLKIKGLSKLLYQETAERTEIMQQLAELSKIGDEEFYHKLFLKKHDKIIALEREEIKNLSDSVEELRWGAWFLLWLMGSFAIMSVCVTFCFVWTSYDEGAGIMFFDWPWRKVWPYFAIAFMAPLLIPCVAVELVSRSFVWFLRKARNALMFVSVDAYVEGVSRSQEKEDSATDRKQMAVLCEIKEINKRVGAVKKKYLTNCIGNLDQKTKLLEQEVVSYRKNLSDLGTKIGEAQRNFADSQRQLEDWKKGLENLKEKSKSSFLMDFDRLLELPHVTAVDIVENIMHVRTDTVFIDYKNKRYEIGIFQVSIDMFNNIIISVVNLTSTHPQGEHHPYGSGYICWGSLSVPIKNTLKEKEYVAAVQYVIQALHSSMGDKPDSVKEWKEVSRGLSQTA